MTCNVEGCEKPARTKKMCDAHYMKHLRASKGGKTYNTYLPGAACSAEGCDNPIKSKGLCNSHYMKSRRESETSVCVYEGCDKPLHGQGHCVGHYAQIREGRPLSPLQVYLKNKGECEVVGCERLAAHVAKCFTHYQRFASGEENWDRPIKAKAANGEGHLNADGYRVVYNNGRPRVEHIVIAEQILGRPLVTKSCGGKETVHHVNTRRDDNRTDGPFVLRADGKLRSGNLEIWHQGQPAGGEIGPQLDWAREMLALYGTIEEQTTHAAYKPSNERDTDA